MSYILPTLRENNTDGVLVDHSIKGRLNHHPLNDNDRHLSTGLLGGQAIVGRYILRKDQGLASLVFSKK